MAARGSDSANEPPQPPAAPRRAGLVQERSRDTRRRLVRAALHLWSERGFETGIEDTTVEEIVQAAGVTKGTFYFHFARKEQILLEMGSQTAARLLDEAERCLQADQPLADSLRRMLNALARQIKAAQPAAVARVLTEFRRPMRAGEEPPASPAFADAFEPIFGQAQERGEVTTAVEPSEMAQILEALVVDTIMDWSHGKSPLNSALHRRSAVVVAGLRPDALSAG